MESGFPVPSNFFDQWLEEVYGSENMAKIAPVFGCANRASDEITDCYETFTKYITSAYWACNTRWAMNGVLSVRN